MTLPSDSAPAVPAAPARRAFIDTGSEAFGVFCGCVLAVGASTSFAFARAGILAGLSPGDLIMLRFGVSAALLFPMVRRWGLRSLAGIGWTRAFVLLALGGPAFALMQSGGYAFAPLAHGGVIHPASVTILSTLMAAAFLHERMTRAHVTGAVVVLLGIVLISWHGLTAGAAGQSWIGDLMFFLSAVLWAGFTVLLRAWKLPAVRAIGVTALLSAVVTVPAYLAWYGPAHLATLPPRQVAIQALAQGVVQGAVAITAYAHSIRVLGVSRAVLFPASVPAVSVMLGIFIVGEVPNMVQVAGLVLVTSGLALAIDLFKRKRPRLR